MPGDKGSYFAVFGEEQEPVAVSQPTGVEAPVSVPQPAQQQKLVPRTTVDFTPGTNVIDLAEVGALNFGARRALLERGFTYQDPNTGELVQVGAGDWDKKKMWEMTRNARRQERLARRWGLGDTTGWSQNAIALRKQQVGNDSRFATIAAPKAEAPTASKTYNYDFGSSFFSGDNQGYADITTGILKALYDNKKYDILDSMIGADGKIGLEGLQKYHNTLGLEGINAGYFDENSINAMVKSGALTQAQADGFITSAKAIAPKPAATPEAPMGSGKWTPEAIAAASVDDLAAGVWRGEFGNGSARRTALGNRYNEVQAKVSSMRPSNKQGGQIMKYFQAGGSIAAGKVAQEKAQDANVQKQQQYKQLVANSQNFFEQLSKLPGEQANKLLEQIQSDAKSVPAAAELLSLIQQWMDRARVAKQGAKLSYIKRLRGECPEGYEPQKFKVGGKVCTKCAKIAAEKCGGKAKKHQEGGEAELVAEFKNKRKKN